MAKATSISASNLAKFIQAAVKAAGPEVPGRLISRGPVMGYILAEELTAEESLHLATTITNSVASNAREAGIAGVRREPVVVGRPGNITVGFIAQELGVRIRE